ncbi:MAG: hypothetical protein M3296_01345, partial [Actinomycetota bacterium]|nr:hypothetical protein [Actinomycetota bacterium]
DDLVRRQIESGRQRVQAAYDLARKTAAGGTQAAIQTAQAALERTLSEVRTTLQRVLASVGLSLPKASASAPAPTGSQGAPLPGILQPAQQLLVGLDALLDHVLSASRSASTDLEATG